MTSMYDEKVHYDLNGNITDIYRTGDLDSNLYAANAIDNLEYVYDTDKKNLLLKVTDATNNPKGFKDDSDGTNDTTDDYTYDDYGNLTSDQNKKITEIVYNHLNLPTQINFDGGNKIEYLYNAAGLKERKTITVDTTETVTDYLDGFQYTNTVLDFFPHAEGYVKVTPCPSCEDPYAFNYVYQYKDHLGNIRLSYAWDEKDDVLKVIEENHYYPFGLKHTQYNTGVKEYDPFEGGITLNPIEPGGDGMNKYKFQSQERQDELGLNWDSFKYRNYDYAIGRFMSIDPLTEKYNTWSPYCFSGNRVMDARELEGLEPISVHTASFAPYNSFGVFGSPGNFKGDGANRGFTTNTQASHRVYGRVDMNLSPQGTTKTGSFASGSISTDLERNVSHWSGADLSSTITNSNLDKAIYNTKSATEVDMHLSGSNSLVPLSPDIDVDVNFNIWTSKTKDGTQALISGEVRGDGFPANETYITDQQGTGVFLGVSGADGTPLTSLPGDNTRSMSGFGITINFNKDGNITNIVSGGKTYSPSDWNKQFTSQNPKDGKCSTNN